MQWRNSTERFGAVSQLLHWGVFVLIASALIAALVIDAFPRDSAGRAFVQGTHESIGLLVLLLACARLAWKLAGPTPAGVGAQWQQRLARAGHGVLYAFMLAIPAIGYVVAGARGHDPAFFGLAVPSVVGADRALARSAKEFHELMAWTLVALVAAHAAAALWHHLVLHDGVLARMLPRRWSPPAADRG